MSSLAWFLALVLGITFFALIPVRRAERLGDESLLKAFFIAYAWLICLVLACAVWHFIGLQRHGTPRLPLEKQLKIENSGYYVAAKEGSEFTFTSKAEPTAFQHSALAEGERIAIKPNWNQTTNRTETWTLRSNARSYPLRVAGRCVNMSEDQWLNSNDTFAIYLTKRNEKKFISIRWEANAGWLRTLTNRYYFSQGSVKDGGKLVYDIKDVLMSEKVLEEGRALSTMARLSLEEFKKIQNKVDSEWWSVFENITWVREQSGRKESRIGVLIASASFRDPNLEFYKSSIKLRLATGELEEQVSFGSTIFYGFGYKDSLSLSLTSEAIQDPVWGGIVEIHFSQPQSWPLPPLPGKPFIITSSNDYIPLDGYWMNLGDTPHPFYAKAILSESRDAIEVNDGKKPATLQIGDVIRLGDFQQGVLVSLTQVRSSVTYAGRWAIAFLIVGTILFTLIVWKETDVRMRLDWAWTSIWGLMLTVLVVRLVLAYRASLLPPGDARPKEIQAVFNKGLDVSLWWAFLLIPSLYLIIRVISRPGVLYRIKNSYITASLVAMARGIGKRFTPRRSSGRKGRRRRTRAFSGYGFALIWAVTVLWIIAGKLFGHTESFLGLRINIITHLLVTAGLAINAKHIATYGLRKDKVLVCLFLLSAVGLMIFLIHDNGFVIYLISFAIYLLLLFLWNRLNPLTGFLMGASLIACMSLPILFTPLLLKIDFLQRVSHPLLPENVFYRVVTFTETENSILLARADETNVSMDLFLRNAYQNWQMLLYSAEGARQPKGYCQAPLSDRGMTYPTSMADCAFSVYLLSEHGKWAGFFLILLYLAIGFMCFYGSWYFPIGFEHRGLILILVGSFFACNTLYTSAANIGIVPFTGQNIPLLSLYSMSDVLQALILFALIALLLRANLFTGTDLMLEDQPAVRRAEIVVLIGVLAWAVLILMQMNQLAHNPRYTRDLNLSPEVFKAVKDNLPDLEVPEKNSTWRLAGERLIRQPGLPVPEIVEQFVNQFNGRSDKFDPSRGVLYLESRQRSGGEIENIVRINANYFKMRSPFRMDQLWRGRITARSDIDEPSVSALGLPFTVSLAESGHAKSVSLTDAPPARVNRVVAVTEDKHPNSSIFCDLIRDRDNLRLEPRKGNWKVYVEGKQVDSGTQLNPFDIIVIEKGGVFRRNLIYLGVQPPILAFVQWRNGQERRIFLKGDTFPLAFAMGQAGDRAQVNGREPPDTLPLTIDISLQSSLNKVVEDYASHDPTYAGNDPLRTRKLALTVLDAFSGDVLALPSWPSADPNDANLEEVIRGATSSEQVRLLENHNLTNHVIGSTIKPIVFATVASQFWPEINIAEISVINRSDTSDSNAIHLHKSLGRIPIEPWDCQSGTPIIDAHNFIVHSLDFYQGITGMLGMFLNKHDWQKALVADRAQPDILYKDRRYAFDLRKVPESPFTLLDPLPRPLAVMDETLLFRGLPNLFQVGVSESNGKAFQLKACERFMPAFCGETSDQNEYLDRVLPEPIVFRARDFQSIRRNLITFFLGAGSCRWNNVSMAEAVARLVTGHRIIAQIQRPPQNPPVNGPSYTPSVEVLPEPISIAQWRNANLIVPMRQAGEIGTARRLKGNVPPPYVLICKTGTIEERENGRESETFMFVVGKWENDRFVPGKTLACFFYMQESKESSGEMKKFEFAKPIINGLVEYLRRLDR